MSKSYNDICKAAKYKLTGHGSRNIGSLIESFEYMDPSIDADVYGTGGIIKDKEETYEHKFKIIL